MNYADNCYPFRQDSSFLYFAGLSEPRLAVLIDIDEVSSLPLVSRVRGRITVTPTGVTGVELPLLEDGTHIWRPFAPTAPSFLAGGQVG